MESHTDITTVLPSEIFEYVLLFLSPEDLISAARVSNYFHTHIINNNQLWREKFRIHFPKEYLRILKWSDQKDLDWFDVFKKRYYLLKNYKGFIVYDYQGKFYKQDFTRFYSYLREGDLAYTLKSLANLNLKEPSQWLPFFLAELGGFSKTSPHWVAHHNGHQTLLDTIYQHMKDHLNTIQLIQCAIICFKSIEEINKLFDQPSETDLLSMLEVAVRSNRGDVINFLINKGADITEALPTTHDTPLCLATHLGHTEALETLLKKSGGFPTPSLNKGQGYMDIAVRRGHDEIIELLVQNGATLQTSRTALLIAAANGNFCTVNTLLELIDKTPQLNIKKFDYVNEIHEGQTALHVAVLGNYASIVNLLLDHNACTDIKDLYSDLMPLNCAARIGNDEIGKLLLNKGANVNARSFNGSTPLHFAALGGHARFVKLLIDYGADVNCQNKKGDSPLHHLFNKSELNNSKRNPNANHKQVIEILLAHGAKIGTLNKENKTPIQCAKDSGDDTNARVIQREGLRRLRENVQTFGLGFFEHQEARKPNRKAHQLSQDPPAKKARYA